MFEKGYSENSFGDDMKRSKIRRVKPAEDESSGPLGRQNSNTEIGDKCLYNGDDVHKLWSWNSYLTRCGEEREREKTTKTHISADEQVGWWSVNKN